MGSAGPALSTPHTAPQRAGRSGDTHTQDLPALMEPLRASRRRPFFFKMKLPPMKMLELIASPRPMQKSYFPRPGLMAFAVEELPSHMDRRAAMLVPQARIRFPNLQEATRDPHVMIRSTCPTHMEPTSLRGHPAVHHDRSNALGAEKMAP